MKWVFIILLLGNVVYLGWEIDQDSQTERANVIAAVPVPVGTPKLELLVELKDLPEKRELMKLDERISVDSFNSEPVLPIELNPNTEKMMDTLLPSASSDITLDENLVVEDIGQPDKRVVNPGSGPEKKVCYTYGPIPDFKEATLLSDWLNTRSINHVQRKTNKQGKQLFWVYLAPQESRALAEAAMRDLKKKGVRDLRLIRGGDLLNAISLGLFSSQASVNRRLNEIATKGYKAVVVPHAGEKQIHWFDVQIVQNSSYVNDLFTGFPARFNALPVECNEIAMLEDNP